MMPYVGLHSCAFRVRRARSWWLTPMHFVAPHDPAPPPHHVPTYQAMDIPPSDTLGMWLLKQAKSA
jgi:hypothetical protein